MTDLVDLVAGLLRHEAAVSGVFNVSQSEEIRLADYVRACGWVLHAFFLSRWAAGLAASTVNLGSRMVRGSPVITRR